MALSLMRRGRGGFTDLASFRAETGLSPADLSDQDAFNVINEDMREQKRIADQDAMKAQAERDAARAEAQRLSQSKSQIEQELAKEKNKLPSFTTFDLLKSPSSMNDYMTREYLKGKIRNEIKDDILFEEAMRRRDRERDKEVEKIERERRKDLSDIWKDVDKPAKSKPRAKPKPRTKSKLRAKSKPRTKSKSKSKKR